MTTADQVGAGAATPADEISRGVKLSWGTGALGVAILMNAVAFLVLFYMVSVLKIEPALAGALIFITKIFDVITDPIVGGWSDRLKSAGSRRRPFLLVGAFVAPISFAMIFTTPLFENSAFSAAYIFVVMLAYTLGYTLFNVPYMSMPAEMTQNYHERSSIHGYRMVFISIGGIMAGALAPALLEVLGRTAWSSYALVGVGGGAVIFISMMIAWAGTGRANYSKAAAEKQDIFKELEVVFKNRHFLRLLAVKFCQLLGAASAQAALVFFVLNVMQLDFKALSYYGLVIGLVSVVASPLIVRLSLIFGKHVTYIIAATCSILVFLSWPFASPNDPLWMFLVRGGVLAVAVAGNVIMAMSMLTDIINHAAQVTGVRREGIYTAFYSFVEKFTFAFGPLIVGVALSVAGFDENIPAEEMRTPAVRQALLLGISYIPAVMVAASIFLLSGYKLREEDLNK